MSEEQNPGRREFLRRAVATGAGAGIAPAALARSSTVPTSVQRYRRLGRTGLEISDISFGSSRLRSGEEALVRHALDRGINYFDSAYGYTGGASETVLGKVFRGMRKDVVLVSKFEGTASSTSADIMAHLDESLRRLQTDYIDVYMNHAVNDVERMQSDEWHAFVDQAKRAGKIRFVGMSGHAGRLIPCLDYALDEDLVDVILCESRELEEFPLDVASSKHRVLHSPQCHCYPLALAGDRQPVANKIERCIGVVEPT